MSETFPKPNDYANLKVNQTLIYGDVSSNYHAATKWYVDKKIDDLVSDAPDALDTLREIVDFIGDESTALTIVSRLSAAEKDRNDISKELHSEISKVIGRIDDVSGELFTEISDVESKLDSLSAELSNTAHDLRTEIEQVSSALYTEVGELEGKISTLSSNVTVQISGEVDKLETAISTGLAGKLDDGRVTIGATSVYEINCLNQENGTSGIVEVSTIPSDLVTQIEAELYDNGIFLTKLPELVLEVDDPRTLTKIKLTVDDTVTPQENLTYITTPNTIDNLTPFSKWLQFNLGTTETDNTSGYVSPAFKNELESTSTVSHETYRKMSPSKGGHFQVAEPSNNLEAYLYIGDHWRITAANVPGTKQLNFEYYNGTKWEVGIPFFNTVDLPTPVTPSFPGNITDIQYGIYHTGSKFSFFSSSDTFNGQIMNANIGSIIDADNFPPEYSPYVVTFSNETATLYWKGNYTNDSTIISSYDYGQLPEHPVVLHFTLYNQSYELTFQKSSEFNDTANYTQSIKFETDNP